MDRQTRINKGNTNRMFPETAVTMKRPKQGHSYANSNNTGSKYQYNSSSIPYLTRASGQTNGTQMSKENPLKNWNKAVL